MAGTRDGNLRYRYSGGSSVLLGYQFKSAEFRDRDFTTDYSYHGLVAGLQFRF